jgi:hypothetical protein
LRVAQQDFFGSNKSLFNCDGCAWSDTHQFSPEFRAIRLRRGSEAGQNLLNAHKRHALLAKK